MLVPLMRALSPQPHDFPSTILSQHHSGRDTNLRPLTLARTICSKHTQGLDLEATREPQNIGSQVTLIPYK